MGIFFALWIGGRILEHRLIHARFRKRLAGEDAVPAAAPTGDAGFHGGNTAPVTG
jgi:hypothetical protein